MSKYPHLPPLLLYYPITLLLFVYSYGFVDFNLTLSSHPLVMNFVSWSQNLAMFHRSTSLYVYLGLIASLYLLYFITLLLFPKNLCKTLKFGYLSLSPQ